MVSRIMPFVSAFQYTFSRTIVRANSDKGMPVWCIGFLVASNGLIKASAHLNERKLTIVWEIVGTCRIFQAMN